MIYSKEIFSQAETELSRRHIKALALFEKRQQEMEEIAPEIAEVNRQLIDTSVKLSKAIMQNNENIGFVIEKIKAENMKSQKLIKFLLADFGYPADYLDLIYTCKNCNDTGYTNGIRCQCFNDLLKKFSVEEINKNSNFKLDKFEEFNLNYYSDKIDEATGITPRIKMAGNLNACKEFVKEFSSNTNSIFMSGKTGLGKTFLSSAIANELLQKGFNVAFDSIQNFLRMIENEHFGRSQNKDTLQILNDADLVILDDLGSEFNSAFYSATVYNIINTRLNRNSPTIISSNLSFDELQQKYDDRIISRITGMYSWMVFVGKDIRQINSVMQKK